MKTFVALVIFALFIVGCDDPREFTHPTCEIYVPKIYEDDEFINILDLFGQKGYIMTEVKSLNQIATLSLSLEKNFTNREWQGPLLENTVKLNIEFSLSVLSLAKRDPITLVGRGYWQAATDGMSSEKLNSKTRTKQALQEIHSQVYWHLQNNHIPKCVIEQKEPVK
ncbi:MAG: hypothetical protein A4S09_10200 [Proteobacteria bacterium SG_bin7]|nr:MAG: hypothetical protein A4S09_10200 [Proteobacteria bacterium SG_bin7]